MQCPTCKVLMRQLPAVYPTDLCEWCGTVVQGSEEERQVFTPRAWQKLIDSGGLCMQDDAAQCAFWLTVRQFTEDTQG